MALWLSKDIDDITSMNIHRFHFLLALKIDRAKVDKEIRDRATGKDRISL